MRTRWMVPAIGMLVACGARTPLGLYESSASIAADDAGVDASPPGGDASAASCPRTHPRPNSCSGWRAAGAEQIVATVPMGDAIELGSAAPNGCGVVVAWSERTTTAPSKVTYATRAIGFDGAPLGGVNALSALALQTNASGSIGVVANGTRSPYGAALVSDEAGCRFLPLDTNGASAGSAVPFGKDGCFGLAVDGPGYSFLVPSPQFETPVTLERVDALGAARGTAKLGVPAGRAAWDRFTFDDGSFVLSTFREDPTTAVYTDWLQHFGADGAARASEVAIAANTAPVLVSASATGMIAGWTWSSIELAPYDRDGHPTAPLQSLPFGGAPYEMTIAPVPNGDVLLVTMELAQPSGFDLLARAIAPNGVPRGSSAVVAHPKGTGRVVAVVDPNAERAVLVWADSGLRALSLECVP